MRVAACAQRWCARSPSVLPLFGNRQHCCRVGTCVRPSLRTSAAVVKAESKPSSASTEDVDVSVFRFTLGIPGFDDKYVPRVVGAVGLLLLAVNHALGASPPPAAQTASEVAGCVLAALCIAVPLVEDRLSELQPGRGRAAGEAVQGGVNTFALAPTLNEQQKKELAWASFSVLKNTNSCSMLVWRPKVGVVMARGAFARPAQGDALESVTAGIAALPTSSAGAAVLGSKDVVAEYAADGAAMAVQGLRALPAVPQGVQSALVQVLPAGPDGAAPGLVVVLCERPRALSMRERGWVAAVASKLASFV